MAQIKLTAAQVTNGSATVVAGPADDLSTLAPTGPAHFVAGTDQVSWSVALVRPPAASASGRWELALTAPYAGTTRTSPALVHSYFTTMGEPLFDVGDTAHRSLLNQGAFAREARFAAATQRLNSMAQLRAVSPGGLMDGSLFHRTGFYFPGDHGALHFFWDASCVLADNGCTIIRPAGVASGDPGRLRAVLDDPSRINVRWAGAKADGVSDDLFAFVAARTALPKLESWVCQGADPTESDGRLRARQGVLHAPGGRYPLSAPFAVTTWMTFQGDGVLLTYIVPTAGLAPAGGPERFLLDSAITYDANQPAGSELRYGDDYSRRWRDFTVDCSGVAGCEMASALHAAGSQGMEISHVSATGGWRGVFCYGGLVSGLHVGGGRGIGLEVGIYPCVFSNTSVEHQNYDLLSDAYGILPAVWVHDTYQVSFDYLQCEGSPVGLRVGRPGAYTQGVRVGTFMLDGNATGTNSQRGVQILGTTQEVNIEQLFVRGINGLAMDDQSTGYPTPPVQIGVDGAGDNTIRYHQAETRSGVSGVRVARINAPDRSGVAGSDYLSPANGALRHTYQWNGAASPYVYHYLAAASGNVQAGDKLEYEVFCEAGNADFRAFIDVDVLKDGADYFLSFAAAAADQNGVLAGGDLADRAKGQWYARSIPLDALVGLPLLSVEAAARGPASGVGLAVSTVAYRNVCITNAGTDRVVVFRSAGQLPTRYDVHYSAGITGSQVVFDPLKAVLGPQDAGILRTGTIDDARLSVRVPLLNRPNAFEAALTLLPLSGVPTPTSGITLWCSSGDGKLHAKDSAGADHVL